MGDDQYRNQFQVSHSVQVTVTLTCGCRRRARNTPKNRKQTYPCPNNLGHGYRVRWVSFVDASNGWTGHNSELVPDCNEAAPVAD